MVMAAPTTGFAADSVRCKSWDLSMAHMTQSGDDRFAPNEQAMRAAAARIRPARRRLTDQQAERIVTDEFSALGIDIAAAAATSIARNLRHPLWPVLHPLRARREGWTCGWRSD